MAKKSAVEKNNKRKRIVAARGARRSSRRNIGESINVIIRLMNDLIRYVFESVSFRFGCLIGCLRVERFEHVE